MADASYRVAPIILIRMAGVPFDELSALATPATAAAARHLIAREADAAAARGVVEILLASRKHDLTKDQFRAWRKAARTGEMPPSADPATETFTAFWQAAQALATARAEFENLLPQELERSRAALRLSAQKYLPGYLVFAAQGVHGLMRELLDARSRPNEPPPPRKKSERARERHLLLYLQRVCGKNDTLSEFGPGAWAKVNPALTGLELNPEPGIADRETFLERWTAHGVAAAINVDAATRLELAPRLHPDVRLEGDTAVFTATGETRALDGRTAEMLRACDGRRPAHSLGVEMDALTALAAENLIRWEMEVPALDPHAFAELVADVARWRNGPVRERWLQVLEPIATLPARFAATSETRARVELIDDAFERLEALGAQKASSRFLYAATNPIGEETFRESHCVLGEAMVDEVTNDAAPWIDLWRDNYAFAASRVAAGLRGLFEKAPLQHGALPLPAFLRHCAESKLPLTGPGMVAFAAFAFQEVKAAFAHTFASRADAAEIAVTPHDCEFVRRAFSFPTFDEYTYPSADLQLSATSVEAVARGDYEWLLAELHPPVALLHHGFYWSCPEPAALSDALTRTVFGQPTFQFGFFAADFTATTTVRIFDALPEQTYFVAGQRPQPQWRSIPPSETEVFLNETNGDVGLRRRDSREYLGSFARSWLIPLGFHPFSFSLGKHTPRLRCGRVIVQRRSWTIALGELGEGDFTGISRDLVTAVERLRLRRDLPRHLYIRPTEQALRRSGAEGRDKDTKPVYIDLESYLFLEVFHRWLVKAGELEATEMLPDPDHLLWQEKDGRRTFEFRTQIVPR